MATQTETLRKSDNQSMRKSRVGNRYFRVDPGYDKIVYENTGMNWLRIFCTFIVFYIVVALFWWAVFAHGIRHVESSMYLFIGVLLIAWLIIIILITVGHFSNKNLTKADRLMLEVNEEKKKKREEVEKKAKREEVQKELKRQEELAMRDSLSEVGKPSHRHNGRNYSDESEDDQDIEDSDEESPDSSEDA